MESVVLFVGDRKFLREGDCTYTTGSKGVETGHGLVHYFKKVVVIGRVGQSVGVGKKTLLEECNIEYKLLPNLSGPVNRIKNLSQVKKALQERISQVSHVVVRLPSELGYEALKLALKSHKPAAVIIGGCAYDAYRTHGSLMGKLYAPIAFLRCRAAVRSASWVSYVTTHFLQCRYPAQAAAKTVAISDVNIDLVDVDRFDLRLKRVSSGMPPPLKIGTIGTLATRYKGIDVAIAALKKISNRLPPFEYHILGGGDPSSLRQLAERLGVGGQVFFDGILSSKEEVSGWLDSIDIYLQPSLTEGLPRATIEAMARGCPVLASNVGGMPELLDASMLHAPGDVGKLAADLMHLVNMQKLDTVCVDNREKAIGYSMELLAIKRDDFWLAFSGAKG